MGNDRRESGQHGRRATDHPWTGACSDPWSGAHRQKLLPFPWVFATRRLARRLIGRIEDQNRVISRQVAELIRAQSELNGIQAGDQVVIPGRDLNTLLAVAEGYLNNTRISVLIRSDVEDTVSRYRQKAE